MNRRSIALYLAAIGSLLALMLGWYVRAFVPGQPTAGIKFDGGRALADVQTQVAFGPRTPGSEGHARIQEWMRSELESAGWQVQIQPGEELGHPVQNLVAFRTSQGPQYILGAHYDTRIYADRDPDPAKQTQPTPGADNGASGVAVLLELARTLPANAPSIWLVFFDAEDNGRIPGWDWTLGSRAFVASMTAAPRAMLLVDMVGGQNPTFYMDGNSNLALRTSIWDTAARLGYADSFIPSVKYNILDDHIPFIQAGIPAVDIIDIDYKYWLTTADTPDKISSKSLGMVGEVLLTWITQQNRQSK
ncbi:MAG TPA: M28 family peptidase [Anaerolineales bacterium]|nr:M28 family peptidase [Anaerolineales bacterium]